jgi:hypothetical protein
MYQPSGNRLEGSQNRQVDIGRIGNEMMGVSASPRQPLGYLPPPSKEDQKLFLVSVVCCWTFN